MKREGKKMVGWPITVGAMFMAWTGLVDLVDRSQISSGTHL
jgi:hypothetical protein